MLLHPRTRFVGAAVKWPVCCVDGAAVGRLGNGKTLAISAVHGPHDISFLLSGFEPLQIQMPADGNLLISWKLTMKGLQIVEAKQVGQHELEQFSAKVVDRSGAKCVAPIQWRRVLALGLGAWPIGILGLAALGLGIQELKRIDNGDGPAEGRGVILFGMISGVLGLVVNASFLIGHCASD